MDNTSLSLNTSTSNNTLIDFNTDDDIGKLVWNLEFGHRIFIIVFGSIGNCLSVVIFSSKHLRHLSSSYYLSALAISDTLFLLVLFVGWLQSAGAHILLEDIYCQLQNYFLNVFGFLSVWFVVAFTVERFIAVQYPLMRPSMCTASRAKAVILALIIVSLLLFVPSLAADIIISTNPINNISACVSTNVITSVDSVMNAVDLALVMIVPSVAIVSINTCICLTVHRLSRMRRRMTLNGGKRGVEQSARLQQTPSQRTSNSQNKVTRLLLVVSTVFVCLNLPSHVIRLILYIPGTENIYKTISFLVIQRVGVFLYYTNFGINFVLYCVTGQNFRKALVELFFPNKVRQQDTTKVTVVSECGRAPSTRRRTVTLNGSLTEAHEMVPLNSLQQPGSHE